MRRVFFSVTIDTEPDSTVRWGRRYPLSFESVVDGIPRFLRPIFDRHGIKPVYFISPAVAEDKACLKVIEKELKKGSEAGNHLHPDEFPENGAAPGPGKRFACSDISDGEELFLIRRNHDAIAGHLGVKPVSYRAGRFGADIKTIASLEKAGYLVDSSVTPGIDWSGRGGPDFRGFPRHPYFVDVEGGDFGNEKGSSPVLEVPVTVGGKRFPLLPEKWYFRRWLRPSFMTTFEMKRIVDEAAGDYSTEDAALCMMFHAMEVIPGASPYVRSAAGQKMFLNRLESVCRHARERGYLPATLEEIYASRRAKL